MKQKWIWKLVIGLLALWLFNQPGPGRAAGPLLQVRIEPSVGDIDTTFTAVIKNLSWDEMALVRTTAFDNRTNESQIIGPEEDLLAVGPRRRAIFGFTVEEPGYRFIRVQGSWLNGGSVFAETAVPVVVAGAATGEIALGQTVQGNVLPGNEASSGVWAFQPQEDAEITLTLDRDPNSSTGGFLSLLDTQGNSLAFAEELIANVSLQEGLYFVHASASGGDTSFDLTLTGGLSGDNEGGAMEFDTAVTGLIEPQKDTDSWTFTGSVGDIIAVTMRKAGNGTLDSELTLTDPNGNVVAANNNYNDQDAQLIYLIPADGQYQIVAQSYNSNSSGAYRLRLVHGDNVGEDLAQSVPILRLGVAEQGIVPPNGAQAWQFQGEAGDEVTISVQALEEGFDPLLILYGLDGAEIANDDDRGGGLNPSLTVTLPESGTYTASITSYDGSNGRYMIRISHP